MTTPTKLRSQPAINAPIVVIGLALVFIGIHVGQTFLTQEQRIDVLLSFAFIPARYGSSDALVTHGFPGGLAADAWTFFSYAFLHADWVHLAVNCFWMLAFGSVVARRMKPHRFLAFSALCAIGGAALHLAIYWGQAVPVIGASAAISGQMAGAVRFIFARPSNLFQASRMHPEHQKAESLVQVFSNPRALIFLGVWFGINLLFGITGSVLSENQIAWEAHVGGFVVGLVLFGLFDRATTADA